MSRLYRGIVRDPRHRDVTLLDFGEIEERRFASWRMGLVDLNKVNIPRTLRYSETAQLDPFAMTARHALALLEDLSEGAAIDGSEGP